MKSQHLDKDIILLAMYEILQGRDHENGADDFKNAINEITRLRDHTAMTGAGPVGETVDVSADPNMPVGLGNLRNTCYLNSILQYFYTVHAVSDLVLGSTTPRLEPTDQSMRDLLGRKGSKLEPGRAFVGCECTWPPIFVSGTLNPHANAGHSRQRAIPALRRSPLGTRRFSDAETASRQRCSAAARQNSPQGG